ncbi:MAG: pyruvate carboxyltransferase [Candidatus Rokubacteria bacterium]|nr:pyruvate carboxyltransferase [Candidatus Rokubacteria bacterium]
MANLTPWHTDKWFVSPWNYMDEVVRGFHLPKRVKFHDVCLRDGEQQAGIEMTPEEKVKLATMLAEAGVHRIEGGMPAVSPADAQAIKTMVKKNLPAEIFAFSRCMKEDVKRSVDCGVKGIVMEVPSSEHIIEYAYKWSLDKAVETSIEATRYAKSQGLYVVFFPIDASRADMAWYLKIIEQVASEGHMDALALVDTFGVLSPHAVSYFVRHTREHIKKPLETHFHMDFGMGVANTVIALAEGAEVVHSTISGIGERAGNAPTEETLLALLTMYGVDTGIKTEKLTKIAQYVRKITRQPMPTNRPIVGDMLFDIESGIIASWYKNAGKDHFLEVFPFHPKLVGQKMPRIVLGKNSGIDSIRMHLDRIRVKATDDQVNEVVARVKRESMKKKGLLDDKEFRKIVKQVVR